MSATYRIGPNDFFTGGDLLADAKTLNTQVSALDAQIEGVSGLDPDLVRSWVMFQADWGSFFYGTFDGGQSGSVSNFLTALNDGNRDQLIQFENRFADLHERFKAVGIDSAAADVAVSLGAPDTVVSLAAQLDAAAKRLLPFGLGLGAFAVIALVVWFVVIPRLAHG